MKSVPSGRRLYAAATKASVRRAPGRKSTASVEEVMTVVPVGGSKTSDKLSVDVVRSAAAPFATGQLIFV